MKYIHLTGHNCVRNIKSNGINLGDGRRGKGVYFIPYLYFDHKSYGGTDLTRVSNVNSWKFWVRSWYKKHAAIVFEPYESLWPIDVYIDISSDFALKFAKAYDEKKIEGVTGSFKARSMEETLKHIESKLYVLDCHFKVSSDKGLGQLLRMYTDAGGFPYGSIFECVSRTPVKKTSIKNVIPFYKVVKGIDQTKSSLRD